MLAFLSTILYAIKICYIQIVKLTNLFVNYSEWTSLCEENMMTRRTYWGVAALIILVIAAGGFIYYQWSQVQHLKEELAQEKKMLEDHDNQQPAADNKPPREARAGHKWEWHTDHWHEMPIAQNDVPQQTHESEEIAFEAFELKSDLPDELPEKFPTKAELQKMNTIDILHLSRLYEEEVWTLAKTDYDAAVKLHNTVMPKLWARGRELIEESNARTEESNRRSMEGAGFYPATDEVPAKIITVIDPNEKTEGEDK